MKEKPKPKKLRVSIVFRVFLSSYRTKNNSIGFFNSATIEWLVTLFMFLGAIPLTLYHSLLATKDVHSLRSSQVSAFVKILAIYILPCNR